MSYRVPALVLVAALVAGGPARADEVRLRPDSLDPAYAELTARGAPHHLRTTLEEIAMIALGTTWYWLDRERQVGDWDYPSIKDRLTFAAWRFDNNPFGINFIWHPIDGAAFHAIARSNQLGLIGAVGYGFATQLAWEYLLEFREKVSINDNVVTPGAGIAIGEFAHWMGRYLASAPSRGVGHEVARWALSPFHALHGELDGLAATDPARLDALGLTADIWHRFEVGYRLVRARPSGPTAVAVTTHDLVAAGRLAALPGYLRPIRMRRGFADGNLSALAARVALGGGEVGLQVAADVLLVGYHVQEPAGRGGVHALTIGLDLALDYRRERAGGFKDRVGLLHLPGLGVDAHVAAGPARLTARLRGNADFAGLHALAYPAWDALHPAVVEKTILDKQGYYYGFGGSGRAELELAVAGVELGGSAMVGRYASIEGFDRSQEGVTSDVEAADTVSELEAFVRIALHRSLRLEVRAGRSDRASEVGELTATQRLRRISAELGASF